MREKEECLFMLTFMVKVTLLWCSFHLVVPHFPTLSPSLIPLPCSHSHKSHGCCLLLQQGWWAFISQSLPSSFPPLLPYSASPFLLVFSLLASLNCRVPWSSPYFTLPSRHVSSHILPSWCISIIIILTLLLSALLHILIELDQTPFLSMAPKDYFLCFVEITVLRFSV